MIFLLGCAPSADPEEPPIPPNIIERAEVFFQPTGTLTENNLDDINEWLLTDGGMALLGSNVVLNYVLPSTLGSLNEGLGVDQNGNEEITFEDLAIEGDGWLRLTQPCGAEENKNIVLSTLFSTNGFDPRFFGSANQCEFPDYDLQFGGELSFLLPLEIPFVDTTIWSGEDGAWMFFDGNMDVYGYELSSKFDVMLDSELRSKILWKKNNKTFVVTIPDFQNIDIDFENFNIEDLEEIKKVGIEIATEEGIWNCIFLERICEGPNNQSIDWL
jgi:hypothetical protein